MAKSISVAVGESETILAGRVRMFTGPLAAGTSSGKLVPPEAVPLAVFVLPPESPQAAALMTTQASARATTSSRGVHRDIKPPPVGRELRSSAGMAPVA